MPRSSMYLFGFAVAALSLAPAYAGEGYGLSPKLMILEVDPASPLTSVTRGLSVPDVQTTGSIDRSEMKLALAAAPAPSDPDETATPGVDISLSTGSQDSTVVDEPAVPAAVAPIPARRPSVTKTAVAKPVTIQRSASARRTAVALVSDEAQPRKKRIIRYPGPVLVGVYN